MIWWMILGIGMFLGYVVNSSRSLGIILVTVVAFTFMGDSIIAILAPYLGPDATEVLSVLYYKVSG